MLLIKMIIALVALIIIILFILFLRVRAQLKKEEKEFQEIWNRSEREFNEHLKKFYNEKI